MTDCEEIVLFLVKDWGSLERSDIREDDAMKSFPVQEINSAIDGLERDRYIHNDDGEYRITEKGERAMRW